MPAGNYFSLDAKVLKQAGFGLLSLAILANPWVVGKLLAEDGRIDSVSAVYKILVMNGILFIVGCFSVLKAGQIKGIILDKTKVFTVTMVFLTIVIVFFILELYIRLFASYNFPSFTKIDDRIYSLKGLARPYHYTFDSITGYSMIPNIHDDNQSITTDEYGFRTTGRNIDLNRESIIFVGDSTVFGWGVKDTSTFPYLIAQNENLAEFNVINMGVPAYSLGHIVSVLENKVVRFKPKIVFVSILWPWKPFDAYSSPTAWKEVDYDFYRQTIPLKPNFVVQVSIGERLTPRLILFLRDCLYRSRIRVQIRENLTRPGVRDFSISMEDERKLAMDHISLLKEACRGLQSNGVKLVCYIHPYQYTVFNDNYRDLGKLGRGLIMQELGALSLDDFLRNEFSGEPLFIDGSHLTDLGHAKYAEYFLDQIKLNLEKTPDHRRKAGIVP